MLLKSRFTITNAFVMGIVCTAVFLAPNQAKAQTPLPLNDLSSFKAPGKSWKIVGDVSADLNKTNQLTGTSGSGILINLPVDHNGADLYTNFEHGDIDLELDYMMAKESNSGIYLQGRYEIQLLDSWGKPNPKAGDNGGIYQRWDDSKPEGQKGFEGYAPRQNASKAPGLWQHIKIVFQAPRFDGSGNKTENARILRIELNGVTIHENAELTGPTRGSMAANEQPMGPLRFQGDHGAVAFRNIKITSFDKQRPVLKNIRYTIYKGRYFDTLNLSKLPPEASGTLGNLSASVINKTPEQFFIKYNGTINIKEPGNYNFNVAVPGGMGLIKINDQASTATGRNQRSTFMLPAGDLPFEILYAKNQDWAHRSMALNISGPGIREFSLGDVLAVSNVDPILIEAPVNTTHRSFMDIPGGKRIVHAISVGSPLKVHYTYDLENGALVQVWRGGFLDATPMWYSRGDGSSKPLGAVQYFGMPVANLNLLSQQDAPWTIDSAKANYKPLGYRFDKNDLPTFMYSIFGAQVDDALKPLENGEGFKREITVKNSSGSLSARLAEGSSIQPVNNNLYIINDKAYYVRIDDAGGAKPIIRNMNGRQELVIPIQSKIGYSILF